MTDTPPQAAGHDPEDFVGRWLIGRHQDLLDRATDVLDVEAGLREILQARHHTTVHTAARDRLDVEAGLAAITGTQHQSSPVSAPEASAPVTPSTDGTSQMPSERSPNSPAIVPIPPDRNRSSQSAMAEAGLPETSLGELATLTQALQELPTWLPEVHVPYLSFQKVAEYFRWHRPRDRAIRRGVLLRQPHSAGMLIYQVLINDDYAICEGRVMVVWQLDSSLTELFERGDGMIVFEQ